MQSHGANYDESFLTNGKSFGTLTSNICFERDHSVADYATHYASWHNSFRLSITII